MLRVRDWARARTSWHKMINRGCIRPATPLGWRTLFMTSADVIAVAQNLRFCCTRGMLAISVDESGAVCLHSEIACVVPQAQPEGHDQRILAGNRRARAASRHRSDTTYYQASVEWASECAGWHGRSPHWGSGSATGSAWRADARFALNPFTSIRATNASVVMRPFTIARG